MKNISTKTNVNQYPDLPSISHDSGKLSGVKIKLKIVQKNMVGYSCRIMRFVARRLNNSLVYALLYMKNPAIKKNNGIRIELKNLHI